MWFLMRKLNQCVNFQASKFWQEVASWCNSSQVTVMFAPQTCCQFVLFEVGILQHQLGFASQMPCTARNSQIGGYLDLQRKGRPKCGYVSSEISCMCT